MKKSPHAIDSSGCGFCHKTALRSSSSAIFQIRHSRRQPPPRRLNPSDACHGVSRCMPQPISETSRNRKPPDASLGRKKMTFPPRKRQKRLVSTFLSPSVPSARLLFAFDRRTHAKWSIRLGGNRTSSVGWITVFRSKTISTPIQTFGADLQGSQG